LPTAGWWKFIVATKAAINRLTGDVRQRGSSRWETTSPRNVFRTKDGHYIGISAAIQAMAERLFRAIGREDMITDPHVLAREILVDLPDSELGRVPMHDPPAAVANSRPRAVRSWSRQMDRCAGRRARPAFAQRGCDRRA
jgi:crotonobetainyl-CoA:carnitine CoA-transferase CaiB-like acyl-CoA transferase